MTAIPDSLIADSDALEDYRSNSLWRLTLRRLLMQRSAVIGLSILGFLVLVAIFAPVIAPYDPIEVLIGKEDVRKRAAPCIHLLGCPRDQPQHIMGTDGNVRDQFSRPSGGLGRLVGFVLAMANRKINRWTLTGLEAAPGDQLLEIGFGPGLSIRRSARLADRVAGIDVSEVMLDQARRRNRAAVAAGRVDLRRGSVEELPWEDGAFDRVYAVNSVQVWPDLDAGLAEVRRVLRPGGRLVLTVGQPRWAKDAETIRRMGETTARRVGAAGFSEVELEVRRIGGMNAFRLRAVLPAP